MQRLPLILLLDCHSTCSETPQVAISEAGELFPHSHPCDQFDLDLLISIPSLYWAKRVLQPVQARPSPLKPPSLYWFQRVNLSCLLRTEFLRPLTMREHAGAIYEVTSELHFTRLERRFCGICEIECTYCLWERVVYNIAKSF
uniref:Uncharacterized protein n=1 Tax=Ixodes scapularis TaxID=6945 RepID=A0A4D5RG96_IXOSC